MRRLLILLSVACLLLAAAAGCGVSGTSITGQVVLNGVGTDDCTAQIIAAGSVYDVVLSSDGRFALSDAGPISEVCVPEMILTFEIDTEASGACLHTFILEYPVVKGENDLGAIEIGTQGLQLTQPAVGTAPSSWPVSFSWHGYNRTDLSDVTYTLALYKGDPGSLWVCWGSTPVSSSPYSLYGSETSMDGVTHWAIWAKSTWRGTKFEQYLEPRVIDLPAVSGS